MECYGNPFVDKRIERTFVSPQIKILLSQYNTLLCLIYCKQSYCDDIQIYMIFGTLKDLGEV